MRIASMATLMLSIGMNSSSCFACDVDFTSQSVPVYPPSIQVMDKSGRELGPTAQPRLEFRSLKVSVPFVAKTGDIWRPQDLHEAATMLACVLPKKFYKRLLNGYTEYELTGEISSDPAVSERVGDVAKFITEIWELNSQFFSINEASYDGEFEFLFRILAYIEDHEDVAQITCAEFQKNKVADGRISE